MKQRSLLRRVFLRLALVTVVTIVATLGLLLWQYEKATEQLWDARLVETLEEVRAALEIAPDGRPLPTLPEHLTEQFSEDFFVAVTDRDGRSYFSIPPGLEDAFHPFEPDRTDRPQFFEHRYMESHETYLGVTAHVWIGEHDVWVQVVEEVPFWQTLSHRSIELFARGVGVIALLHMIAAAGLCYFAVSATLAPVRAAADEARRIGPGSEHLRISTGQLPQEVVPLAVAVNDALDRLKEALEAQRRFTADAAHELLTPIAVIRANSESIEDAELRRLLLTEIDEMTAMARQLLELAELESITQVPQQSCDLREIAADALARHADRAIDRGMDPRLTGGDGPVLVRGCRKALRSAIENLVSNAVQHAEGASILEVSVTPPGKIVVMDDGAGVPEAERVNIFERFRRSGTAASTGRGLGLAIVRRIVHMHGGSVRVTEGAGGRGAAFEIDLAGAALDAEA